MLDYISISHNSGLVLWSRSFTPNFAALAVTPTSPVNALVKDIIEGKPVDEVKDGYNVRWTVENGLGLVFVVVYPALLPLGYVPALLERTKELYLALFQPLLEALVAALSGGVDRALARLHEKMQTEAWDAIFDRCLKSFEHQAAPKTQAPEQIARNVEHLKARLRKSKTPSPSPTKQASKLMRKWNDSAVSEQDMAALDYSAQEDAATPVDTGALISQEAMGTRVEGRYVVADWGIPSEEEILARREVKTEGLFARLGKKLITKEDLEPVLMEMEKHLMGKNVAKEISEKLCRAVGEALLGKSSKDIKGEVQKVLSASLTRILTPKSSTDILLDIQRKGKENPYAITFVGVNGVGKSTNLSKVCFWLLQNGHRVLIAACDTFRSGAVEQLRVHVRNLGALSGGGVELYERGYGKDAAGIAKDAIAHAKKEGFDVVLIDTAGRMQDNEPLMRALAKLVTVNNPDKIVFVGEALVGNEAVDQLTKFDRSLRDWSKRGIDGILLTKFDTIDDKVGAALSMTYVTGQPIYFVGCGQTYTDLRQLSVGSIVQALLS